MRVFGRTLAQGSWVSSCGIGNMILQDLPRGVNASRQFSCQTGDAKIKTPNQRVFADRK